MPSPTTSCITSGLLCNPPWGRVTMLSSTPPRSAWSRFSQEAQSLAALAHALRLVAWLSAQAAFAGGLERCVVVIGRHYGPSHAPPFAMLAVLLFVTGIFLPPILVQW